ncbi:MerR family transcriptional regulator [Arenimonas daejeonensis]|uniref:MerR family transcriptional regulator n=1 Tax=Arenimonas daejeonensis TaxID=370777 RepID=UPI001D149A10|nr:MerR family transcriptional regulator [Arenimonas daejeonensis]
MGRRFGLSRSTLLYYDRIGLLSPGARSGAGYRLYSADDVARLQRIVALRAGGLPLDGIRAVLDSRSSLTAVLEQQLVALNGQMRQMQEQQRVLCAMLGQPAPARGLDKAAWTTMFRAIGLDDEGMRRWHVAFEARQPEAHRDFLVSLGLDEDEIGKIRAWSRNDTG